MEHKETEGEELGCSLWWLILLCNWVIKLAQQHPSLTSNLQGPALLCCLHSASSTLCESSAPPDSLHSWAALTHSELVGMNEGETEREENGNKEPKRRELKAWLQEGKSPGGCWCFRIGEMICCLTVVLCLKAFQSFVHSLQTSRAAFNDFLSPIPLSYFQFHSINKFLSQFFHGHRCCIQNHASNTQKYFLCKHNKQRKAAV